MKWKLDNFLSIQRLYFSKIAISDHYNVKITANFKIEFLISEKRSSIEFSSSEKRSFQIIICQRIRHCNQRNIPKKNKCSNGWLLRVTKETRSCTKRCNASDQSVGSNKVTSAQCNPAIAINDLSGGAKHNSMSVKHQASQKKCWIRWLSRAARKQDQVQKDIMPVIKSSVATM